MIKATLKQPNGRTLLAIGLSFGNLNKFRAAPGDGSSSSSSSSIARQALHPD